MNDPVNNGILLNLSGSDGYRTRNNNKQQWLAALEKAYLSTAGSTAVTDIAVQHNAKPDVARSSNGIDIAAATPSLVVKQTSNNESISSISGLNGEHTLSVKINTIVARYTQDHTFSYAKEIIFITDNKNNIKSIAPVLNNLKYTSIVKNENMRIIKSSDGVSIVMSVSTHNVDSALSMAKQVKSSLSKNGYLVMNVIINGDIKWSAPISDHSRDPVVTTDQHLVNFII